MILLTINFNSLLSQTIGRPSPCPAEAKPLAVLGNLYGKIYTWLEAIANQILAESEELTAEEVKPGLFAIHDNKGNMFTTQYNYCSCFKLDCKHQQLFRELTGKLPSAILGSANKIKSPTLRKIASSQINRSWELVEF